MSLSSIQSNISSTQRELQRLQRRLSEKSRDLASKSKRIAEINRSISRTTNASSIQIKLRQVQSLENDVARLQSDIASLNFDIAKKTEKLHNYQNDLYKEQAREQNSALRALERKQDENLRRQQALVLDARNRVVESAATAETVDTEYDVFISHASEDKDDLVRPLADALVELGLKVWYDEIRLKVGDNIRRSIDVGLAKSKFGIVVLSPSFFAKNWTQYELDGLVQRELGGGKVILPLWHRISKTEVMGFSPSLADKLALNTATYTIPELASELASVVRGI